MRASAAGGGGGARTSELVVDVVGLFGLVGDDSPRSPAESVGVLPVCVAVEVGACCAGVSCCVCTGRGGGPARRRRRHGRERDFQAVQARVERDMAGGDVRVRGGGAGGGAGVPRNRGVKWALIRNNTTQYNTELRPNDQRSGNYVYLHIHLSIPPSCYTSFPPGRLIFGFPFLPIFQPHPRSTFTTFGVTAAVSGTLTKMNDLCTAYASASSVHTPVHVRTYQHSHLGGG